MALTVDDYDTLTQKLNEWYFEGARERVAKSLGMELFDAGSTDWQVYNYLILNSLGRFDRIADGQQIPVAQSQEGDSVSATQKHYAGRVEITPGMRKFERYDQMEEVVKSEVDFAFDRIDQAMADLLTNGFSGTSYTDIFGDTQSNTSPDNVVFFSASHTNNQNSTTARNLIRDVAANGSTANPALSRSAIVQAGVDGMTHKDPNGINRPIVLDTLLVSATNDDLANRLVLTPGVAMTPNVDINPVRGKIKNIQVWSRLDTRGTDSADTSAYWFMYDSKNVKKTLKSPFAQRVMMHGATQIHDTLSWSYPIDAYWTMFIGQPYNVFGSTGAN